MHKSEVHAQVCTSRSCVFSYQAGLQGLFGRTSGKQPGLSQTKHHGNTLMDNEEGIGSHKKNEMTTPKKG